MVPFALLTAHVKLAQRLRHLRPNEQVCGEKPRPWETGTLGVLGGNFIGIGIHDIDLCFSHLMKSYFIPKPYISPCVHELLYR